MADVFGANVVGGEETEEGRSGIGGSYGGFDGGAGFGFFAFDKADGGDDVHAGFFGGFDGGDGRGPGGADVVDDDDGRAFFEEAFDAAAGAVGLFGFADEEAVDERRRGHLLSVPGACRGDVGDEGVGAHGESTDGRGLELVVVDEVEDGEAGEASALGVEGGGAAVDVVVAVSAGGEGEFAEL